jgi:WD40 repeat protein
MTVLAGVLALGLAAQARDEELKVEKGAGPCAAVLKLRKGPLALAASPDGRLLAIGSGSKILLTSFEDGRLLRSVETGPGYVRGLAFSPDGKRLAAGVIGGLFLIDAESGKVEWKIPAHPAPDGKGGQAYGVAFRADGSGVFSVSPDEPTLRAWSVKDGSALQATDTKLKSPEHLARSGERLAVGSPDGTVVVYDGELKELWRKKLRGLLGVVEFTPTGASVAVGLAGGGAMVNLFKADAGEPGRQVLASSKGKVTGLAWCADGKRMIAAGTRGVGVRVWDEVKASAAPTLVLEESTEAAEDADRAAVAGLGGKAVAVAGKADEVRIYRIGE